MAAGDALQGHGVAMFRLMEELGQRLLRMAHFNNAKPVSDHHPMNKFHTLDSDRLSRNMRVKLDETGIYAGKIEPQRSITLPLQPYHEIWRV